MECSLLQSAADEKPSMVDKSVEGFSVHRFKVDMLYKAIQEQREYYCLFNEGELVRVDLCLAESCNLHAPIAPCNIKVLRGSEVMTVPVPTPSCEYSPFTNRFYDAGYLSAEEVLAFGYAPFLTRGWQAKVPLDTKRRLVDSFIALPKDRQRQLLACPRLFSWSEDGY